MDAALVYWLYAVSFVGLALGGLGTIVLFFLYLFKLVD